MYRVLNQQCLQSQSPACYPNISTTERAKNLFLSTYVFRSHSIFHYLKEFEPKDDEFFIKSAQSVSLAYLANDSGRAEIMRKARMMYSEALVEMRKVLGKKDQVIRQEALATVLLMDSFEKLNRDVSAHTDQLIEPTDSIAESSSRENQEHPIGPYVESESRHMVGALALCKLRGPSQFEDPLSVSLFHHMSCNILHSCMIQKVAIPVDYLQLRAEAAPLIQADDQKWRAENLLIDLLDFRNAVAMLSNNDECTTEEWKRLEKEYIALCKMFPHAKIEFASTNQNAERQNPLQGRNHLCHLRGTMDDLYEECEGLVLNRKVTYNRDIYQSVLML